MKQPLVSIVCISYNHEQFISQAIGGFLMQKTTFPFEIICFDDASTDNTQNIIMSYAEKYPNLFRLFLQKENLWLKKGISGTFTIAFPNAQGKYIAWCEGDDYWTSPEKLQKQVDFLETHLECSTVFHWADLLEEHSGSIVEKFCGPPMLKEYYTADDLLENNNFIPTCSVMFRNGLFKEFPAWFFEAEAGDFVLHILNARHGKIGFIDESMAVYRRHAGGVWAGNTEIDNVERTIRVYLLIGQKLDYLSSVSFKKGLWRWMIHRQRLSAKNSESAKQDMNDFKNRLSKYFLKLTSPNTHEDA